MCRIIGNRKTPHLIGFAQRNIVEGPGGDAVIICSHTGIAHTVAAFTFITVQIFAHWLPGGRPVIFRFVVTNVKVSSGLIKVIEYVTENSSVSAGFCKTISACIIGNDCSVIRRSQIIYPWRRRVWAVDDIFPVFIVKISISHIIISVLSLFL